MDHFTFHKRTSSNCICQRCLRYIYFDMKNIFLRGKAMFESDV